MADSYFDPELLQATGAFTSLPHALSAPPANLITPAALVIGIDPSFRNPMSFQAATGVDRAVAAKLGIIVGYLRNSTWALQRSARIDCGALFHRRNIETENDLGTAAQAESQPHGPLQNQVVRSGFDDMCSRDQTTRPKATMLVRGEKPLERKVRVAYRHRPIGHRLSLRVDNTAYNRTGVGLRSRPETKKLKRPH